MKRQWITGLILIWLATPGWAQCAKQITLFLDISGSMSPQESIENSPYKQTLEALKDVLEENFLGPNDQLEVYSIGESTIPLGTSQGPEQGLALLERLQKRSMRDNLSDLTQATQRIANTDDNSRFVGRIFIIASDFVHEHEAGARANSFIDHWTNEFSRQRNTLSAVLEDDRNQLVLFIAPPARSLEGVRQQVLRDLESAGAHALTVGSSRVAIEAMAADLRKRLLQDLQVDIKLERNGFQVVVRNTNCTPQEVREIQITCLDPQTEDESTRLNLPFRANLAPVGSDQAWHNEEFSFTSVPCPLDQDYRVSAFSVEGASSNAIEFSSKSILDIVEGRAASKERWPFGQNLRVLLDLKGQEVGQAGDVAVLVRDEASGQAILNGSIPYPANISNEPKPFLLIFKGIHSLPLRNADTILVSLDQKDSRIPISLHGSHSGDLQRQVHWITLLLAAIVIFVSTYRREPNSQLTNYMTSFIPLLSVPIQSALEYLIPSWGVFKLEPWELLQHSIFSTFFGIAMFLVMQEWSRHSMKKLEEKMETLSAAGSQSDKLQLMDEYVRVASSRKRNIYVSCTAAIVAVLVSGIISWFSAAPYEELIEGATIIEVQLAD